MKATVLILFVLINLNFIPNETSGSQIAQIECEANTKSAVYYYDCSNKNLTWSSLKQLYSYITSGSSIDLSNNKLLDIDDNNGLSKRFPNLNTMLNLSTNRIESISNLNFPMLKILDLSHNRIQSVDVIISLSKALISLDELYLTGNPIEFMNFTNAFNWTFKSLKRLYLSECNISRIDLGFFNTKSFPSLEYVDLSRNSLHHLDELDMDFDLPAINLLDNELKCDCDLLWYKKHLQSNKRLQLLANKIGFAKENNECYSDATKQSQNIVALNDHLFQCPLNLTVRDLGIENNMQTFECIVEVFPEVNVWWSFEKRVLSKTNEKNPKYNILKSQDNHKRYFFSLKSKLIISDPNHKDNGDYICHVSYSNDDRNLFFLNYTDQRKINKNFTDTSSSHYTDILVANQLVYDNSNLTRQLILINGDADRNVFVRLYRSLRSNHVYLISFVIFSILLTISLILICIMCVLLCRTQRRRTNKANAYTDDNLTIKHDLSIDEYDKLNQSKIREHVDPFLPQYHPHHYYSEYANVSKDDDALSSVDSIKNYDTVSSVEENLDDYNDPLLINIRKPSQNLSAQKT
jgi:hypothetical protein